MKKGNHKSLGFALLLVLCLFAPWAQSDTLFFDNFESGNVTAGGWINEGTQMNYTYKVSGVWSVEFNSTDKLTKARSTAGYDGITLSYWRYCRVAYSWEKIYVEYTTNYGQTWTSLESPAGKFGWTYKAWALPSTCANNPNFGIRFRAAGSSSSRWYIDDVTIAGNPMIVKYTLNTSVSGSGTIALDPPQPSGGYEAGTVVKLTAWPNSGYKFNGWSGDLTGLDNPQWLTMTSNKSVTATFVQHSTNPNTSKYWDYRDILRSRYVLAGEGQQGNSNVATYRIDSVSFMKWSDQTIRLGWYIGMLATEYYMLNNPQNYPDFNEGDPNRLNTCATELYYALRALQRLDVNAESSFVPNWPDTPGFFIRDEVPLGFQYNFPGITYMQSDYSDPVITNKEMSQDQVYHVMFGLALAKTFLPGDLVINGLNLRQFAITEATNIVTHVKNGGWVIKNPVTGNDVARGADATAYAHGLNKVLVYITDGAVDYVSSISETQKTLWNSLSDPNNPAYLNIDNLHMSCAVASAGNGWGTDTLDDLQSLCDKEDWWVYQYAYAAMFKYVATAQPNWPSHHYTIDVASSGQLSAAPSYHEPRYPVDQSEIGTGWCASHRFLRSLADANYGEQGATGQSYPGLDYMLLHNLAYIVSPAMY